MASEVDVFFSRTVFSSPLEVTLSIDALARFQWQAILCLFLHQTYLLKLEQKSLVYRQWFLGVVDFFHLAKETKINIGVFKKRLLGLGGKKPLPEVVNLENRILGPFCYNFVLQTK